MNAIELKERVKLYLKQSSFFILGIVVAFAAGTLIAYKNELAGQLIILLLSFLLFMVLQIRLGTTLINKDVSFRTLKLFSVVFFVTVLLFLKVTVNEELNLSSSCIGRLSGMTKIITYYSFCLWSTLFIWEAYYLITNEFAKRAINLEKYKIF